MKDLTIVWEPNDIGLDCDPVTQINQLVIVEDILHGCYGATYYVVRPWCGDMRYTIEESRLSKIELCD